MRPLPRKRGSGHGRITCSRMEKTALDGADLNWIYDPIPPFVGERIGLRWRPVRMSAKIVDLLNWIGSPNQFPLNQSFVFVAYFIRAYLRGASFGTKLNGGT